METQDYLKILAEEIHSVVVATVDERGLPATRVIDIMLYDKNGIYFLTARGKAFYRQLKAKPYLSLSGMSGGRETMSRRVVSLSGAVKNTGSRRLNEIFEKNPYMYEIYPAEESRKALEVFCLYKGQGEYFDLSTKPISRRGFTVGKTFQTERSYRITAPCSGCGACLPSCPQNCIETGSPYRIIQENCLHCGNCYEICPENAILSPRMHI